MKIPLPGLMRHWREEEFNAGDTPLSYRLGLKAWAAVAKRPRLYHGLVRILMPMLGTIGSPRGVVPPAAASRGGWTGIATSPPRRGVRSRRCGPTPRRACRDDDGQETPRRHHLQDQARASARTIRQRAGPRSPSRLALRRRRWCRSAPRGERDGQRQLLRKFLEGQSATVIEVAGATRFPWRSRASCAPPTCRCGCASVTMLISTRSLGDGSPRSSAGSGRAAAATTRWGSAHAVAAVAETGTLVLASGPDNPVTLDFLPETHIVVVEEKDLVGGYEGAWEAIRARFGTAGHAAHGQLHLGAVAHGRYRRAAGDGRARAAPAVRHPGAGLRRGELALALDAALETALQLGLALGAVLALLVAAAVGGLAAGRAARPRRSTMASRHDQRRKRDHQKERGPRRQDGPAACHRDGLLAGSYGCICAGGKGWQSVRVLLRGTP